MAPALDENGAYPMAVNQRPLTLPKGMVQLVGQLNHVAFNLGGAGMGNGLSATALAFGAAYGVTDKIQLGASTALILDPDFESSEVLNMSGGHQLSQDRERS